MRLSLLGLGLLSALVSAVSAASSTRGETTEHEASPHRDLQRRRRMNNGGSTYSAKSGYDSYYGAAKSGAVSKSGAPLHPSKSGKGGKGGSKSKSSKKGMMMGSKSSKKGKGKGGNGSTGCPSEVAEIITAEVPEAVTQNPGACCGFDGPQAVFVTHAEVDENTESGFEPFWNEVYLQIVQTSAMAKVCFVMTGVNQNMITDKSLADILIEVNSVVSSQDNVPAMMTTDPTDSVEAIAQIRAISDERSGPHIGVFNAGYDNILIEAVTTNQEPLPYIGYLNDEDYGTEAGSITLDLLDGAPPSALCFNARLGVLDFIGERCAAYYNEVTGSIPDEDAFGLACSSDSTVDDILAEIMDAEANAVWSSSDCCTAVAQAAGLARQMSGRMIIVGCMDEDTSDGLIDFITTQPNKLQAYQASSWVNFPVIQVQQGGFGRAEQFFPSLQSLINTDIYNIVVFR